MSRSGASCGSRHLCRCGCCRRGRSGRRCGRRCRGPSLRLAVRGLDLDADGSTGSTGDCRASRSHPRGGHGWRRGHRPRLPLTPLLLLLLLHSLLMELLLLLWLRALGLLLPLVSLTCVLCGHSVLRHGCRPAGARLRCVGCVLGGSGGGSSVDAACDRVTEPFRLRLRLRLRLRSRCAPRSSGRGKGAVGVLLAGIAVGFVGLFAHPITAEVEGVCHALPAGAGSGSPRLTVGSRVHSPRIPRAGHVKHVTITA
jgi:hypothetical protein